METKADVYALPPSFALYLQGAVIAPVLVKIDEHEQATVYVPPVLASGKTAHIVWSLVLLSGGPGDEIRFDTPAITFQMESPPTLEAVGPTQVSVTVELENRAGLPASLGYDIHFEIYRRKKLLRTLKAHVKADPTVGVTTDPVDIPTWP